MATTTDRPAELPEVSDIDTLAAWLDVHPRTVRRMVDAGTIPHLYINKCLRFERGAIKDWLKEQSK